MDDPPEVRRYRDLMAALASGVGVVTALDEDGRPQGMTCTSLTSVTLCPPTLLVSLRHGSATLAAVAARRRFAVNLLHGGATEVAQLFAAPVPSRFSRVRWQLSPYGAPWLCDHTLGVADCVVVQTTDVGDHQVVFGEVAHVEHDAATSALLLYGLRRFGAWDSAGPVPVA